MRDEGMDGFLAILVLLASWRFNYWSYFVSFVFFVVRLLIFSVCFRVFPWLIGFCLRLLYEL